ncbi:hypothetical protein AAMO2058_000167800 [Amorphochlora amoebiformis]
MTITREKFLDKGDIPKAVRSALSNVKDISNSERVLEGSTVITDEERGLKVEILTGPVLEHVGAVMVKYAKSIGNLKLVYSLIPNFISSGFVFFDGDAYEFDTQEELTEMSFREYVDKVTSAKSRNRQGFILDSLTFLAKIANDKVTTMIQIFKDKGFVSVQPFYVHVHDQIPTKRSKTKFLNVVDTYIIARAAKAAENPLMTHDLLLTSREKSFVLESMNRRKFNIGRRPDVMKSFIDVLLTSRTHCLILHGGTGNDLYSLLDKGCHITQLTFNKEIADKARNNVNAFLRIEDHKRKELWKSSFHNVLSSQSPLYEFGKHWQALGKLQSEDEKENVDGADEASSES